MTPAPDLKTLRFGALLNTSSGGCDPQAEPAIKDCFREAGITAFKVWCGPGGDLEANLALAAAERVDVLVVLGGDGTIRAAAEQCGAAGTLLIPLPGGTMNMLPKTLYGQRAWREALSATLASPAIQPVHGGEVDGRRFFVAAIFGEPARFADAREAVREGDIAGAIGKGFTAIQKALEYELSYKFNDAQHGSAEAVTVICPLTSSLLGNEEEVLEAAAIDPDGPIDALRLALHSAFSTWRSDPTVDRAKVEAFDISAEFEIPALLDGERFTLPPRARVSLVRNAFTALRPAGDD
jgi:diacylglycerol kinase family enzyme